MLSIMSIHHSLKKIYWLWISSIFTKVLYLSLYFQIVTLHIYSNLSNTLLSVPNFQKENIKMYWYILHLMHISFSVDVWILCMSLLIDQHLVIKKERSTTLNFEYICWATNVSRQYRLRTQITLRALLVEPLKFLRHYLFRTHYG